jgi:hypothetical protein
MGSIVTHLETDDRDIQKKTSIREIKIKSIHGIV